MLTHAFFDELQKIAEDKKKSPAMDIAKIVGSGLLGFGVGTTAGLGAGYLADSLHEHMTGRRIPRSTVLSVAPLLGTASGIAYSVHKAKELEAIHRALKDQAKPSSG